MIHNHLLICERFNVLMAVTGGVVLKLKVSGQSETQPRVEGKGRGHDMGSFLLARTDSFTIPNATNEMNALAEQMPQLHGVRN
jgi:hypothetical protein